VVGDGLGLSDCANLEAVIVRVSRNPWRMYSSRYCDPLGGHNQARLEIHFEGMIVRTCRPKWCEVADALGSLDRENFDALIDLL